MSRIGKKPITVPGNVEVAIDGTTVRVKGPKGQLERTLHKEMIVRRDGAEILVERPSDEGHHKALHGLTRTLVANMIEGVVIVLQNTSELDFQFRYGHVDASVPGLASVPESSQHIRDWIRHHSFGLL